MLGAASERRNHLDELATLAQSYGDDALRSDVTFAKDQMENDTASVAVLGQFKRGKSTLLNALLGEEVLPTGRLPLTGVTTRVVFGERGLTVLYFDGRADRLPLSDLNVFVTEEHNPKNRLRVEHVDVALPHPMLRDMSLIDTPGIGSTFAHNTVTAREASERIDLALFVTGPEPPITQEEATFLVQTRDLAECVIVVVAKIDLVLGAETEILDFTRRTVRETLGQDVAIVGIDAVHPDERISALRQTILNVVTDGEHAFGRRSLARRIRRIVGRLRRALEMQRAAAVLPASEREQARATFAELADEIDERGSDLVRAIEQFPSEELIPVDNLLDALSDGASIALSEELAGFVDSGPDLGERAIHARIAAFEAEWSYQVSQALIRRIEKRRGSALQLLCELEKRFAQAASSALGLHWKVDEDDAIEFGAYEAATRMSGPLPTTGLELVTSGIIAVLPPALRVRALRKRFAGLMTELLDRSKGRVRSAAVRFLLEWRLANVGLVRERLLAARRIVENAFERATEVEGDSEAQLLLQRLHTDERILDAVVATFS